MRRGSNEHLMWSAEDRRRRAVWIRLCSIAGAAVFFMLSWHLLDSAYGAFVFHKPVVWGRYSMVRTYRFEDGARAFYIVAGLHLVGGMAFGVMSAWYLLKGIFERPWL
jgi:hypothetical protein